MFVLVNTDTDLAFLIVTDLPARAANGLVRDMPLEVRRVPAHAAHNYAHLPVWREPRPVVGADLSNVHVSLDDYPTSV